MTSRWYYAIGLAVFFGVLAANIPATFVDSALSRPSNGKIRLVEAQGTVWYGAGLLEIRDMNGRVGVAKPVSWRALPWSLIRGHLVFDVLVDQSPKSFPVTISLSRIKIENANISLPAVVLGLAVPQVAPLGLGGQVTLHVSEVTLQSNSMLGNATVKWISATSALTQVAPFGDYELIIDSDENGNAPRAVLRTLRGPLQMDGKNASTPNGQRMFLVTLKVPEDVQPQLRPLLRLIAVEVSQGVFELKVK